MGMIPLAAYGEVFVRNGLDGKGKFEAFDFRTREPIFLFVKQWK